MGAGQIEQIGTPEDLYLRPATALVAEFVGLSSRVAGLAAGAKAIVFGQEVPLREPVADGPVEVYLRPENLRLVGPNEPGVDAVVAESSFLGSFRRTLVRTADNALVRVQHPATDTVAVGDRLRVSLVKVPVLARPAQVVP